MSLQLAAVLLRIDALLTAVFDRSFALRVPQPRPPTTVLSRILQRRAPTPAQGAVPATDGYRIWLPASFAGDETHDAAAARLRTIALLQAMRASRGSAQLYPAQAPLLSRELYLLLEARATEEEWDDFFQGRLGLYGPRASTLSSGGHHSPALPCRCKPLNG